MLALEKPVSREEDISQLRRLLMEPDADEETVGLTVRERLVFDGMLARCTAGKDLSSNQRRWLHDVFERITGAPQYENLWSSKKAPRGVVGKTELPEVLKRPLPMKPPGHIKKEKH